MRKRLDGEQGPTGSNPATGLVRTTSSDPPPEDLTERRWRRRPAWAALVRLVIVVTPLAASIAAGVAGSRLFRPTGFASLVGWFAWTAVLALSALAVVDVAVRRLLPLQRLLQLCLVFPDRAPSRLRVAVQAARPRRPEAMLDVDTVPPAAADAAAHVVRLLAALSVHDRRTRGHSERVCAYTELLADQMDLDQRDRDRLMWVALVHDIGKLHVPRRLLNKPGRPTVSEWHVLQEHPSRGADITAPMREWLGPWADAVAQHHERFDGGGYPRGLRGEEICLGGRILAVTDAFEVMTAPRAYRRPVDAQAARAELARHAGGQFDPDVVRHFLAVGLPELSRAMGWLAWLGQLPFIRQWPRLQSQTSAATTQAVTSAAVTSSAAMLALGAGPGAVGTAIADVPPRPVPHHSADAVPGHDPATGIDLVATSTREPRRGTVTTEHRHHGERSATPTATAEPHHSKTTAATDARPAGRHDAPGSAGAVTPQGHGDNGRHLGWTRGPHRRSDQANAHAAGPRRG